MTKGDAKQWLDAVIEAQDNYMKLYEFDDVRLLSYSFDCEIYISAGFAKLAEAIGAEIETYTHTYSDGAIFLFMSFDYKGRKVTTSKRIDDNGRIREQNGD